MVVLLLSPLLWAQEERENDFGIWTSADFSYNFKRRSSDSASCAEPSRWSAGLRVEYRSRDLSKQTNLWFVRPSVGFRATKWLRLALSYDYFWKPTVYQHRLLFDATESLSRNGLTISLRERFIVAYAPESHNWSWLLRPKLTVKYHIGDTRISPYLACELYVNKHWSMMHNFVGTSVNLGKGSSLDLFYMFGLNNGTNRQDHILGVGYALKL